MPMGQLQKWADFQARLKIALKETPLSQDFGHTGTAAAVLALFGFSQEGVCLLLTRRTETVETHKGQIAFPGGVTDPDDSDAVMTALRETEEEVGIHRSQVHVLGQLPPFSTMTGFVITPIIGVLENPVEEIPLKMNPYETDEILWVPLKTLLQPGTYRQEPLQLGTIRYFTHVYQVGTCKIWGATGAMIKSLLDRLTDAQ